MCVWLESVNDSITTEMAAPADDIFDLPSLSLSLIRLYTAAMAIGSIVFAFIVRWFIRVFVWSTARWMNRLRIYQLFDVDVNARLWEFGCIYCYSSLSCDFFYKHQKIEERVRMWQTQTSSAIITSWCWSIMLNFLLFPVTFVAPFELKIRAKLEFYQSTNYVQKIISHIKWDK